ncbi:MAG: hypothetical protein IIA67_02900 [Planctomycetes bacterium]|nr:hypothetical protein [Planctomycetota bacterium]
MLDARGIPGTELIVATFSSCHDRPWGALAVIDPRRGTDGKPPVVRIWPASARDLIEQKNYDTFKRVSPKYEDAFPLSARYFLCSRTVGKGEQMGIYLLDVFGNEILLHSERDGSVYFSVPADTFIYFQLLDERGMMVQSMRSGTIVRPGETVGCVGCHEKQQQTAGRSGPLMAMMRPPSELAEWYGPPRKFSYTQEVQPAFNKHCVSCHDYRRSPLGPRQLGRLSQLTGLKLTDQRLSAHVSFTRPELSPCLTPLAKKNDAAFRESLAIIRAGKKMLAQRPRADMPGFQYLGVEAEREDRYRAYQQSGGAGKGKDATRE